uniref:Uncharacterized protein n=1 Tax=Lactuca sativa TaxID=4236 RepID=A0A9R1WML3_LACSA|nr:hypothetical protein LSAT_V11C100047290 [Lactuca sativa]
MPSLGELTKLRAYGFQFWFQIVFMMRRFMIIDIKCKKISNMNDHGFSCSLVIFDFRFCALLAVTGSLAGSLLCFLDCYPRKRVRKHATNIVLRKKWSLRRRKRKLHAGKHVGFLKGEYLLQTSFK